MAAGSGLGNATRLRQLVTITSVFYGRKMPGTREKFTLMKSRRDNGQGSETLTEEDNENDREGLDESKRKRCLSKKRP